MIAKPPQTSSAHPARTPPGYLIRERRPGDDEHFVAAENAANRLFVDHGYPQLADDGFADAAAFRHMIGDGRVFVAAEPGGPPVGYAVIRRLGDHAHLRELAVHPAHGRKGLGRALVGHVLDVAAEEGRESVSLSTFRGVPFNQPFYESMGFRELSPAAAPALLADAFRSEIPAGIDESRRVLMHFPLRK